MFDADTELPRTLLAYYARVEAEVLNFRRAMIREYRGKYYLERCLIKVDADGMVTASRKDKEPTTEEQAAIKAEWVTMRMPRAIEATEALTQDLIKKFGDAQSFVFRSRKAGGGVVMVQERRVNADGDRLFVPWTYFSDGQWRPMEPDGKLPMWKPEKARSKRIMIHEGAKAAMAAEKIATDPNSKHPWAKVLSTYEHWGMIGGALAPHRTDYDELTQVAPTAVVYVCDNDYPGKRALKEVSKCYGRHLVGVMFDDFKFKDSWDMADPMPEELFSGGEYHGPELESMMMPATWATESVNTGQRGRPQIVLKPDFAYEWFHSVVPEAYAHRSWPSKLYSAAEFNNAVRPYSDVDDTARLVKMQLATKGVKLVYTPERPAGIYSDEDSNICLNTHQPSPVKVRKGSPQPFLDFMEHLVPGEADRKNFLRWIATLIARPDIKMLYGVLLISTRQGVGKGTLGEKILAPLIGRENVSTPSETEIVEGAFNYWAGHKRLAIVHEIYAGHSSKAYNKLKSIVTDDNVTVNKKYMAAYQMQNWLHFFACSNSTSALKLSADDRRWFVPRITEKVKSAEYWEGFNLWLRKGGLGIIKRWAEETCQDPAMVVMKGERAPDSVAKQDAVRENYSEGMNLTYDILDAVKTKAMNEDKVAFVLDTELVKMVKGVIHEGRQTDRIERRGTLRAVAAAVGGWYVCEDRLTIRKWGGLDSFGARVLTTDPTLVGRDGYQLRDIGEPVNVVEMARKLVTM
jgi:hypothetical protein